MAAHVRRIQHELEEGDRVQHEEWQGAGAMGPPTPAEVAAAAERFQKWLRWYLKEFPDIVPNQSELARRIGVDRATITILLRPGHPREVRLRTLMGFSRLVGYPIDHIISHDPPAPKRRL